MENIEPNTYALQLSSQLRKGYLTYCVLLICQHTAVYSSDIIKRLHDVDMMVVEGTMYPLLARLQRDGLLTHEWQESEQGPPRKYYRSTALGDQVRDLLAAHVRELHKTLTQLEKGKI
jgi:PadR family transcriptional regulator PadR